MHRPKMRTGRLIAGLAVLALLAAGCGSNEDTSANDSDGGDNTEQSGPGTFTELDLSAVSLSIGSKDFTENQLVAEMFAQSIEAGGGSVDRQINLGGTNVNRDALLASEIDAYPEYNGTGWTVHLGNDDPSSDPQELYDVTARADLEQNDIQWLGTSAFNNTYGFATGPDLTEENGGAFTLQEMADYLAENTDAEACMEPEFPDRPDGLALYTEATGSDISANQREVMDSGIIYNETATGECAFGEVFTTDGRIPELDLTVVDDGGAFILYNVSFTIRDAVYQDAPDALSQISDEILGDLDADTMAELNRRVDVEGESLESVAKSYLVEQGFI